jgi:hypothetical protein
MDVHEWIRSIAAVASTASAIVAVVTYVKATRKNQLAAQTEEAQRLRERLRRVASETARLHSELHSGVALIAATAAVAQEIEDRFSPTATAEEIEAVLADDPLMLSAAVTGWHKSRAGAEVSDRFAQVEFEAAQLSGGMRALTELVELMAAMLQDGCSPLILYRMIRLREKHPKIDAAPGDRLPTKRLVDRVKVTVQSNASGYYAARYDRAMEAMKDFIAVLVTALCDLPDAPLVRLHRTAPIRRVVGATRTNSIRQLLRELEPVLPKDDVNALNDLLSNVETFIDKQHAQSELARFARHARDAEDD